MKKHLQRVAWVLALAFALTALTPLARADGHTLTVVKGTAEGGGAGCAAGAVVALHADAAPEGQVFYRWTSEPAAGRFDDAYNKDARFTMPAQDVTVTAHYTAKTKVAITVGAPSKTYDGRPASPAAPTSDAGAAEYVYTYLSADGSRVLSGPPQNAGSYRLIVTLADTNEAYFGTSGNIDFTITPATLTITPTAGQKRYIGAANPAFTYEAGGAVTGETPAFSGALSGAADASAAAGDYAVTLGSLQATDSGAFLAGNYTLAMSSGATFAVVPFVTDAVATATDTNLGSGGVYQGDITLAAPAGYTISLTQTGADYAASVVIPAFSGTRTQQYYLKETASGAITAAKDIQLSCAQGTLAGSITVSGTLVYGSELVASYTGEADAAGLSWRWLRGETVVSTTDRYTLTGEDVKKTLTVEATSAAHGDKITFTTGEIAKAAYAGAAPAAPTLARVGGTEVVLTALDGYEYSRDGVKWQTLPTFSGLTPDTEYSFYQRVAETNTHLCSAASAALVQKTTLTLTGTIYINDEVRFGKTLTVSFGQTNNTGTLTYTWWRGGMKVGTGEMYNVQAVDIGNQLSVEVTSSKEFGSVKRILGTVQKSAYIGVTPASPARTARTSSTITLKAVSGNEYSRDGVNWQSSNRFTGLSAGKTYKFYQRVAATATMEASPASDPISLSTAAASSDDNTTNNDDNSGGNNTEVDNTGAETALYSLTLTGDNTRVLSTTMSNLIKGNATQDVTIRLDNASFTFFKGAMKQVAGQLWYDFGVKINGCIHEQAAAAAAGEGYVATVHFNYDGALPASANIKLWLGAMHAGKTLYYYKFDSEARSLSYMQSAVVDTTGWITVVQDSCSDYVFCDRDIFAAPPTPTLEPPVLTPTPTEEPDIQSAASSTRPGLMSGWLLALIICVALLFIIGGIWLYVKNRDE